MLIEGNKVPIAGTLQTEQIQRWMASQTSPSDVFRFLMLSKAGDNLLDNPQFLKWVQYVDDLNKANPDKKTTIMSVLGTYYTSTELTKILEVAAPSKLVKRLEAEQKWLGKDTPDELFKILKLDKAGDELLSSPQFKTWVTYMKEFNMENYKYKTTLIATLVRNYGDGGLVTILEAAKGVKSTASTAKRLQSEQFQLWLTNGYTPDDIFKVLKLDKAGDNLLTNSLLPTWRKYLDSFNLENPTKKTTLLTTLTKNKYSENSVWCSSLKQ
ncbi:hypothetical protein V7S43_017461 [Phytophthora oleae]|uniref:RxLR effector PexRD54 WY domain-containing protein n=1 Tax=Phytophthora oleae TaxID=2107226 RepID=A0ABD3EU07_9STRA